MGQLSAYTARLQLETFHLDYRSAELQRCSEKHGLESLQIFQDGCSNTRHARPRMPSPRTNTIFKIFPVKKPQRSCRPRYIAHGDIGAIKIGLLIYSCAQVVAIATTCIISSKVLRPF